MATGDAPVFDRALGAYLGFAVGDALGVTVEFTTRSEIAARYGVHCRMLGGGWLNLLPGQVTDDTEMTLAVGRAIIRHGGWDLEAACDEFGAWLKGVPVDVGNTCRRGIRRYLIEASMVAPFSEGDAGNGACMRNLPIALAALHDPALFDTWTLEQFTLPTTTRSQTARRSPSATWCVGFSSAAVSQSAERRRTRSSNSTPIFALSATTAFAVPSWSTLSGRFFTTTF